MGAPLCLVPQRRAELPMPQRRLILPPAVVAGPEGRGHSPTSLQVLRPGNRLSITPVTPQEWRAVLELLETP